MDAVVPILFSEARTHGAVELDLQKGSAKEEHGCKMAYLRTASS